METQAQSTPSDFALMLENCADLTADMLQMGWAGIDRDNENTLILALAAKALSSARSILVLVPQGRFPDAILIGRSIFDISVYVEYILCDATKKWDRLCNFSLEEAYDRYDELCVSAELAGSTPESLAKQHPEYAEVLAHYEAAKKEHDKKPAANAPQIGPPPDKRWKHITIETCCKR